MCTAYVYCCYVLLTVFCCRCHRLFALQSFNKTSCGVLLLALRSCFIQLCT